MNNILPELLVQICDFLPCKYIILLSLSSNKFNKIIDVNNSVEKKKYEGFPRTDGHCFNHEISELYDENFGLEFFNSLTELYYKDEDDPSSFRIKANTLLNLLINNNFDLVRGDLIFPRLDDYRNNNLYIFDGCEIIGLDMKIDDYGALPQEFTVINNNVPIDYWNFDWDDKGRLIKRGISHNGILWFDINDKIRKQLITNIKSDGMIVFSKYNPCNVDKIFYTSFISNNIEYFIISINNILWNNELEVFTHILSSKSKILIESFEDDYEIFEDETEDNMLFLRLKYNTD